MLKLQPADFYTRIESITEAGLLYRVLIGLEKVPELQPRKDELIAILPSKIRGFMEDSHHGMPHSKTVKAASGKIMASCPKILRLCDSFGLDETDIDCLMIWASVLHDFARSLGYDTLADHQRVGAELARACFEGELPDSCVSLLSGMISRHDYVGPLYDREELPLVFMTNPLAEVFRLADKTSLPPAQEIERYYWTGKQFPEAKFFEHVDPEIRFSFKTGPNDWKWDYLSYFLLLFAIQPCDWFFGETRDLYRQWEGGKHNAAMKIIDLAYANGYSQEDRNKIMDIILRFTKKFNLPTINFDFVGMIML